MPKNLHVEDAGTVSTGIFTQRIRAVVSITNRNKSEAPLFHIYYKVGEI